MIPFSAIWLSFFAYWEGVALGMPGFAKATGHVDTSQVVWGHALRTFLLDAWLQRRTFYAITNRRVLLVQRGFSLKTWSVFANEVSTIEREGAAIGTLWLGPKDPVIAGRAQKMRNISRFAIGDVSVLADIDEVSDVHR